VEDYYKLIHEGTNLDFANEKGQTPLMQVAKGGDHTLLKLVIKQTSQLNVEDENGNSAMYYAVEANDLEAVKILYESGANITDFVYMIALHNKRKKIIEFFDKQDSNKDIFL
jgi:serine/threonine-protein phosphatase 6 regulatory ankyrin repeat subunit B